MGISGEFRVADLLSIHAPEPIGKRRRITSDVMREALDSGMEILVIPSAGGELHFEMVPRRNAGTSTGPSLLLLG